MNVEVSFWQITVATLSFFIFWTATIVGVVAWLNTRFNALLKRTDFDIRHELLAHAINVNKDILEGRMERIGTDMSSRLERLGTEMNRRMRKLELWAASRGTNGEGSYRFPIER